MAGVDGLGLVGAVEGWGWLGGGEDGAAEGVHLYNSYKMGWVSSLGGATQHIPTPL